MEAKELRIGNWVKVNDRLLCAYGIRHDDETDKSTFIYVYDDDADNPCERFMDICIKNIEPIPLTEDILLKCGFKKISGWNEFILDDLRCEFRCDTMLLYYPFGVNIKYLHQLQNLYFALTNKELDIKL